MEPQRILIKLHDETPGYAVSPQRVPLATLAAFTDDVAKFLRGNDSQTESAGLDVAIVDGSLGCRTEPIASPSLWSDLRVLAQTSSLDAVTPRRREVVERWQKRVRGKPAIRFEIHSPALVRPIVVSADSDFHCDDADQWVRVERYVRGEIFDLGGRDKPNAHISLPDGKRLTVQADRAILRDDKANRLYKSAMVRISAEYNVVTREYRDARLIEFVEQEPRVDEHALARLAERGAKAWRNVPQASAWVDQLRGQEG